MHWHVVRDLLSSTLHDFASIIDPIQAEMVGAMLLSAIAAATDVETAVPEQLIPALEGTGDPAAAGALAALSCLGSPLVAERAAAGLQRLRARGVVPPDWAQLLTVGAKVSNCRVLYDQDGKARMLAGRFDRQGWTDAFMIEVEPRRCGEASDIVLIEAEDLTDALAHWRKITGLGKVRFTEEALDPPEFRWRVEVAMDARDDHDRGDAACLPAGQAVNLDPPGDIDLDDPGYRGNAPILRARLRRLPPLPRGKPLHGQARMQHPAQLLTALDAIVAPPPPGATRRQKLGPRERKVPPRRRDAGPKTIFQVRVELRDSAPPLWRRLEFAGDDPLSKLHRTLQVTFGLPTADRYVFDTAYGAFGRPGPGQRGRSDRNFTVEQVAGAVDATIRYTPDIDTLGEYLITVEQTERREIPIGHTRCTDSSHPINFDLVNQALRRV